MTKVLKSVTVGGVAAACIAAGLWQAASAQTIPAAAADTAWTGTWAAAPQRS